MKQKILLGVLVASIFLTFFSVNVSASEGDTNISVVDEEISEPITTPYYNYIVYSNTDTTRYFVRANITPFESEEINMCGKFCTGYFGGYDSLDSCIDAISNGTLKEDGSTEECGDSQSFMKTLIYSSHNVILDCGSFLQAPLKALTQAKTVGQMTPHQIVQATLKQKVYLLPFLIVSVVGFLAFRKGLAMLFRTLGKA